MRLKLTLPPNLEARIGGLILRRLANLDTYLEQLAPYRAIEVGAYVQDWKTPRIVERTLHPAIETCMDVADRISKPTQ